MNEPIDTMTRRAVAKWARTVALETDTAPDHATRGDVDVGAFA